MPAQDISASGGQTTSDPHAQLLSIQEKIAVQTGGQTPNVTVNPPSSPPVVASSQPQIKKVGEPIKPVVKPAEEAKSLPEDKVPQAVADDVVNQLNGGGAAPRLEGFDPKDKNLLQTQNSNLKTQNQNSNSKTNDQKLNDDIHVNPLKISENPSDNKTVSPNTMPIQNNIVNPNSALELMKADIFKLLGMGTITEAEKKKNLDEMEETIWQDFVEADLPEMLPAEQKERFLDLLKTAPSAEKIINFFGNPPAGGLPKDFEQKYLRKTLDFKAEIVKEQIETLLLANDGKDVPKVELLKKAQAAATQGFWKQVEDLMKQYPS